MAEPTTTPTDSNGLKVINASLFRMGTKSMAQAYKILGYKTHHGLLEDVMDTPWSLLEKAAEATWPSSNQLPLHDHRTPARTGTQFVWGSKYDLVTDLASPFAPELIKAFPEAKVVVVQRDFDKWLPSFKSEIRDKVMKEPNSSIVAFITSTFLRIRPVHAMKKVLLGFFGAKIRMLVPPERRLEYKLGSGWEPLCAFLGVEVPDVDFPQANEAKEHSIEAEARQKKLAINAIKVAGPWIIGIGAVAATWLYTRRR
ncbi:hypothetical protein C8J57DRAFT_1724795 [Mycena rebaudengoi]|nr:hypothetical protein C8J57DRAFT_1724795 [Mycena rebaudengoi]